MNTSRNPIATLCSVSSTSYGTHSLVDPHLRTGGKLAAIRANVLAGSSDSKKDLDEEQIILHQYISLLHVAFPLIIDVPRSPIISSIIVSCICNTRTISCITIVNFPLELTPCNHVPGIFEHPSTLSWCGPFKPMGQVPLSRNISCNTNKSCDYRRQELKVFSDCSGHCNYTRTTYFRERIGMLFSWLAHCFGRSSVRRQQSAL